MLDSDAAQAETWSVVSAPAHGTLVAAYTTTSTGGILTPTGLSYTPAPGYTGNDSFKVSVTDCVNVSDTTTVHVTIVSSVPSVSVTGAMTVCQGAATGLGVSPGGGAWSSLNTAVATAGAASGIITGVSAGTAVIGYALSIACGSAATTVIITVNPVPAAITGSTNVCATSAITLSDATTGGAWSSGNTRP